MRLRVARWAHSGAWAGLRAAPGVIASDDNHLMAVDVTSMQIWCEQASAEGVVAVPRLTARFVRELANRGQPRFGMEPVYALRPGFLGRALLRTAAVSAARAS